MQLFHYFKKSTFRKWVYNSSLSTITSFMSYKLFKTDTMEFYAQNAILNTFTMLGYGHYIITID